MDRDLQALAAALSTESEVLATETTPSPLSEPESMSEQPHSNQMEKLMAAASSLSVNLEKLGAKVKVIDKGGSTTLAKQIEGLVHKFTNSHQYLESVTDERFKGRVDLPDIFCHSKVPVNLQYK